MKRAGIKAISVLLGILMLCFLLPVSGFLPESTASAVTPVKTYDDVRTLLETILSETEGMYWNRYPGKVNGRSNANSQEMLFEAAESGDYASVCTMTRCTGTPRHDENGCQSNIIEGCRQCQGFVKWLGYCLTGQCPSGNRSTSYWTRSLTVEKDFILKPGDVIHKVTSSKWGHYMMVVGISEENPDNVILIDCNSDGGCMIASHEIRISTVIGWIRAKGGFICRYKGFEDHTHVLDENGDCTLEGCDYHGHSFNEQGYCVKSTCGEDYINTREFRVTERTWLCGYAMPAYYKGNSGSYTLRTRPYGDAEVKKCVTLTLSTQNVMPEISRTNITGSCINSNEELWYEMEIDGEKCYVNAAEVKIFWFTQITAEGVTYPMWGTVAGDPAKTAVMGTIYSSNMIDSVRAEVYLYNNNTLGERQFGAEESNIRAVKFSLDNEVFDAELAFRNLLAANTYRYLITVTDVLGGTKTFAYDFYLSRAGEEYYTVSFDANGGTDAPGRVSVTAGSVVDLSLQPQPTREGYTLLGWSEKKDASAAEYTAQYLPASSVTLYAVWQQDTEEQAESGTGSVAVDPTASPDPEPIAIEVPAAN